MIHEEIKLPNRHIAVYHYASHINCYTAVFYKVTGFWFFSKRIKVMQAAIDVKMRELHPKEIELFKQRYAEKGLHYDYIKGMFDIQSKLREIYDSVICKK